ncbi:MAG: EAL domain-containing protein, partial [Gammaproteobacteria bacterium]|nr:EAL domain-containing protein [Gammaproteobacteria bacterium]
DLDGFKLVNDTLGHSFGDKLLKSVAERLVGCVRETDTVSRQGGDEFLIILSSLKSEEEVNGIANKCLSVLGEPFVIGGHKIITTTSIGISFCPKDGLETETLIRNADIAMYRAKELGRNNFQFFTKEMNEKVLQRLKIENQLHEALKADNQFFLVYQPIVNLTSGRIVSAEALLRWEHPQYGLIKPTEFISIAEESGMIIPLGEWTLRAACAQAIHWQKQGLNSFQISVNLSMLQFKQANFLEQIERYLKEFNLDAHFLAFELTENIIMDNVEKNIELLMLLRELGVSIVIDDFGTGYSSLNYLKNLPVNKVKIDRSFICDIPYHADDVAITSAIIALAHNLNIEVIAEGVETEKQLRFLMKHQCDEIQGFYFSKPLSVSECTKLLAEKATLSLPEPV